MSLRQIIKKTLVIISIVIGTAILVFAFYLYSRFNYLPYDHAWFLSDKTDTIDVHYINWACDCADFTFHDEAHRFIESIPEDDFFFIEAANTSLKVKPAYYDSLHFREFLRLTGRFYTDRGISRSYEQKTPEKADHARVFRYDKIEYIDR